MAFILSYFLRHFVALLGKEAEKSSQHNRSRIGTHKFLEFHIFFSRRSSYAFNDHNMASPNWGGEFKFLFELSRIMNYAQPFSAFQFHSEHRHLSTCKAQTETRRQRSERKAETFASPLFCALLFDILCTLAKIFSTTLFLYIFFEVFSHSPL